MTAQAQYVNIPRTPLVTISVANTARDGTGTLGIVATAPGTPGNGRRFDRIQIIAGGTTTVNVVRLFITQGRVGAAITSVTGVGTTATVTTSIAHGMTTGDLVTMQGCFPFNYNVSGVAVIVTGASTFTYIMASTPTVLTASTIGSYSTTPAIPVTQLWREILVPAITPSTSVAVYSTTISTANAADTGYMPLILDAGHSLRASTNNAETYYIDSTNCGDFS